MQFFNDICVPVQSRQGSRLSVVIPAFCRLLPLKQDNASRREFLKGLVQMTTVQSGVIYCYLHKI